MRIVWTDEVIGQLRQLWGEGHSASLIGKRMGVSKNAIVGKAHRIGLPPRPSPIRFGGPKPRPPRNRPPRVRGPTLPKLSMELPKPKPEPRYVQGLTCQFPIGEPKTKGFRFCDEGITKLGSPYCATHRKTCYYRMYSTPSDAQLLIRDRL